MKIAVVTPEFVTENNFDGGLANYSYRLARSLIALGHEPHVFVPSQTDETINFDKIKVHRMSMTKSSERITSIPLLGRLYIALKWRFVRVAARLDYYNSYLKIQSWEINRKIKQVNREVNFDLIHYAHLGGVGYFRLKNVPSVARLSSSTSLCQQYGGYGAANYEAKRQEMLEFKTLKKMDGVFGPSRMVASVVGKEINRQIEIIETPFVEEPEPPDFSLYEQYLKEKKYLLFFGTIGLIKGGGTIAKIIYDVLDQHPDLYFVFVGKTLHSEDPSVSMIDFIRNKAKEHTGRIIRFDKISHAQLYPIISHSFFCVLPSRVDNFPNTCIEAMAHSKIVIGTFHNGFEQLIEQGESGFLIEVDDHQELLKTINKVVALPAEEKKRMENNAAKRTELLKPEKVVVQLVEFYKRAIANFRCAE
jgi:glycosyltransferase involved in cell wall biosynthesis